MDIVVLVEEEFGYRHWLWVPEMSEEKLKAWWMSLSTVGPYFYDGPKNFPGKIHQVYYEPEWKRDMPESVLEEGEFFLAQEENARELVPVSSKMRLPEDHWYAHVHTDCDSYLLTADKEIIHHAGKISEDEYYSDDYVPSEEAQKAFEKALTDQFNKIIKAGSSGNSFSDRDDQESN